MAVESDPRLLQEGIELAEEEAQHREIDREINYKRIERWVMQRDGKDYIQYAGLLDLLHQTTGGVFIIHTHLEQAPTEANGMLAIVSALVTIGNDPDGRTAAGIGDASPASVNRMIAPHLVRMAETRAKGRALRDLLNIPLVTLEELGPDGPAADAPPAAGKASSSNGSAAGAANQGQPEGIVVEGVRYTRAQVWTGYQRRMAQMKAANLPIGAGNALSNTAPLNQLAGATQRLKKLLAEAGQLNVPPAAPE